MGTTTYCANLRNQTYQTSTWLRFISNWKFSECQSLYSLIFWPPLMTSQAGSSWPPIGSGLILIFNCNFLDMAWVSLVSVIHLRKESLRYSSGSWFRLQFFWIFWLDNISSFRNRFQSHFVSRIIFNLQHDLHISKETVDYLVIFWALQKKTLNQCNCHFLIVKNEFPVINVSMPVRAC